MMAKYSWHRHTRDETEIKNIRVYRSVGEESNEEITECS